MPSLSCLFPPHGARRQTSLHPKVHPSASHPYSLLANSSTAHLVVILAMTSPVVANNDEHPARRDTHFPVAVAGILPATKNSQASPFSCNVCGRSYTRLDHLARHFRSRLTSLHPTRSLAG